MPGSMLDNPAITSVLGLLVERPLHLYALSQELPRRLDANGLPAGRGSIRNLLTRLRDIDWIEVDPASGGEDATTYRVTRAGVEELRNRVRSQLQDPSPDHDHFTQAVAYLGLLETREATTLLRDRRDRLAAEHATITRDRNRALADGLPWLHLAEVDYVLHQTASAITWLDRTIVRLDS